MPKDNLEPIGVEAVATGVNQFLNQMKAMEGAYNRVQGAGGKFIGAANKSGSATQKLGGAFSKLLSPLKAAQGTMSTFTTAMIGGAGLAVGMGIVRTAAGALTGTLSLVGNAATAAVRGIVDLTLAASASEGIQNAFQVSAARSGIALEKLRQAAKGTIPDLELMRQTNVALTGAGNELAKEFGESLPRLLEVARASARGTGQDVGFLFQSLVTGVKRTSPMLIDNTGLQLRLGAANESLAASIGKTVEELSAEERQIAILRATLQAGEGVIAQFGSDQLTAAESVAAARAQLSNLGQTIGAVFQPALQTVASTIADFAGKLNMAMQEGGALFPVIVNLGAAASLLADGFSAAIGSVLGSLDQMSAGVNDRMSSMVDDMFNWGVNLVASFADGLAQAIEAFVVPVIQALSNILAGWFAPGSPPKILPEIDTWGAETINEWLGGMSQADFGALKKIQGVLQKALGPETFKAASAMAAKALAGDEGALGALTQGIKEGAHDRLSAYADEIARLVQLEVQLAQAEEQLAAASSRLSGIQSKLAAEASEFNKLLAEGASPEVLNAKRQEIKAREKELELARQQKDEAQAGLGTLKEETALQEDRVSVIMSLTQESKKAGKAGAGIGARAGAGRVAAPKAPKLPKLDDLAADLSAGMAGLTDNIMAATGGITDGIGNAIEAAKEKLKERVGSMFADITARMSEAVAPLVSVFQDQLSPELIRVWELISIGIGQAIGTASEIWTALLAGGITEAWPIIWAKLSEWGTLFWDWLTEIAIPKAQEKLGAIGDAIAQAWPVIKTELTKWGTLFWDWLTIDALSKAQEVLGIVGDEIAKAWPIISAKLAEWGTMFWDWLTEIAIPKAGEVLSLVGDAIAQAWPGIQEKMTGWGEDFWFWLDDAVGLGGEKIGALGQSLADQWPTISARLVEWGTRFWDWLIDTAIPQASEKMNALADAIIAWSESPSGSATGEAIGRALVDGMIALIASGYLLTRLSAVMVIAFKEIPGKIAEATAGMGASIVDGIVKSIGEKLKIDLPALFADAISALGIAQGEKAEEIGRILADALAAGFRSALETAMSAINPVAFIGKSVSEASEAVRNLAAPFEQAEGPISGITGAIGDFASKLSGIQPPAFLNPGSPTPFEIGLLGIATALTGPVQTGLTLVNQAVVLLQTTATVAVQTILAALINLELVGIQPVDLALQFIRDQTIPTLLATTIDAATQIVAQMSLVQTAVNMVTAAVNAATAAFSAMGSVAVAIGETTADAMEVARKEIDSLVKAVDKATTAFENMAAAAQEAATAAAEAGSNTGQASPAVGFQAGTGSGGFLVPPGFPRDSFPLRVSSGERVFVEPRAQAQAPPQQQVTNFYMTVNSGASPSGVIQAFEVMRVMVK